MSPIQELIKEIGDLLMQLINPANLSAIGVISGIVWKLFKVLRNALEKKQDEMLVELQLKLDGHMKITNEQNQKLEREILRLQLLDGMDSNRFSEGEILYLFDKYKQVGGNSFVEEKVHEYVKKLREPRMEILKGGNVHDIK